jgi:FtsP/CotA-like multicopper oxidase with cupredoxin domain
MDQMAGMSAGGQAHDVHDTQDQEAMSGGGAAAHHGAQRRLGNIDAIVLATLAGTKLSPQPRLPDRLAVLPSYDSRAARRRRIVKSEEMGAGPVRFLLNGRSYEPDRIDFACELGSLEIWEPVNEADMDHPFHAHVDPFIMVSRNGRPEPVRMWRDTADLSPGDRVEIIIPFRDFAGNVLYHCHFAEHEDRGMMGFFEVTSKTSSLPTPA